MIKYDNEVHAVLFLKLIITRKKVCFDLFDITQINIKRMMVFNEDCRY
jgi:hypothetical protein